ncbi:integral membrane protein [Cladophialophora carrionii]|uniref:Integral membrane protein n=1 Tax=Cladophialophora carrionii TaxID=86049 RepID=A0A1C1CXY4_9EURO|nr:integral membrane protein [Cladophialophora carrionii]
MPRAVNSPDKGSIAPSTPQALTQRRFANGYDMAYRINTDGLGIVYIGIVIAWTCFLLPAAIFLIRHRRQPYLRMRNIPLAVSAVATLHVYWVLCMIAYVLNAYFPCATEYWIMSIYLPLGIALFQATNAQLLSVATAQKRYVEGDVRTGSKPMTFTSKTPIWRKWWEKVKTYNATKNTMTWIAIGMSVQVLLTLIIFLVSRRFHDGFGITGKAQAGTADQMKQCRRGWEWWPSIAWQIFWSWIYAPVLLWRVRKINDVHGWRKQTVACVLAGLPASPMWLVALYAPGMAKADFYFVPPLWFSPSIVIMQASVIFVPFFQIFKHRRLATETRDIIAEWEEKQKYGSMTTSSTKLGHQSIKSTVSTRQGVMYTMSALERALKLDPTGLLMFSALRDFSGENISFLIHVRDWKANWAATTGKSAALRKQGQTKGHDPTLMRRQFQQAVGIYASFVSLKYSEFPINISSAHLRDLEATFEQYAALVCAEPTSNAATPFDNYYSSTVSEDLESQSGKGELSVVSTVIGEGGKDNWKRDASQSIQLQQYKMTNFGERLPANIGIPDSFDETIFDKAELSIKELVLTNTWAKYVKEGFAQNNVRSGFAARLRAAVDAWRVSLPTRLPRFAGKSRK